MVGPENPLGMGSVVGEPAEAGLNVTALPVAAAVHWLTDEQATLERPLLESCSVEDESGVDGSKVTSLPALVTAVHWLTDGHAMLDRPLLESS